MVNVQIFGLKSSAATRAAERFFKERRIPVQMVDLSLKPMAAGEIRRFVERFGLNGLLDTEGKAYTDAGLKYIRMSDADLMRRIEAEPKLLRLPLVRLSNRLSTGHDEMAWKAIASAVRDANPPGGSVFRSGQNGR
jgi:arsenate reductase-like glutaredoxin family protein